MIRLVSAAQMRALDAETIACGLPAFTLMETAGRGVAERVLAAMPGLCRVAVVCGAGGNGGDGFVAARVLRDRGVDATVYLAAQPAADSAAAQHRQLFTRAGGVERSLAQPAQLAQARPELLGAELVIDALFGVGLTRPVEGHLAHVIEVINAAARCWSIDIPSGLDADRGAPLGACVRAQATVSLGLHKIGVVTAPGCAYAGALHLVDLGLLHQLVAAVSPVVGLLEDDDCARLLPAPSVLDHKGRRGHVLVLGGSAGMRGAAELASTAALRCGAGLATWAAPRGASQAPAGELRASELAVMVRELEGPAALAALGRGKAAWCVGPGLGREPWAAELVRQAIASASQPTAPDVAADAAAADAPDAAAATPALVLDADALFHLAAQPQPLGRCRAVITPHPKEAATLLGLTVQDVEADRLAAARALARGLGVIAVLKGARTIVTDGERDWICAAGTAALATAGTGDVLAGAIAGLCAQGLAPLHAALVAVQVHGHAGRRLSETLGPRGVLASDLPAQLGLELARLRVAP
ncbi:MAG: NAD(P)H-hydrate dehydratase [Myxococcales bacterium]|nr:NAD(P)H-hydrate dehydratase [Myxococcales bacterium]